MHKIALATSDEEITRCFPVMAELRPHIRAEDFLPRVKKLTEATDLKLTYLQNGEVKAVAGFRISEWLAVDGKYLEIEDLVTKSGEPIEKLRRRVVRWSNTQRRTAALI